MILFIDTSGFEELRFALISDEAGGKGGKVEEQRIKINYPETEKTLSYLEKFLKKQKTNLDQVSKIITVSGEGSFTGIRVGASMGLAFSFAKKIPMFAISKKAIPEDLLKLKTIKLKKVGIDFTPEYGAKPNITIKKS